MNSTITFVVNTPLYIEVSFKEFRKMEDIAKLDDATAEVVWKALVKKAGKEKEIMTDATEGYECGHEAMGEVEGFVAETIGDAVEEETASCRDCLARPAKENAEWDDGNWICEDCAEHCKTDAVSSGN